LPPLMTDTDTVDNSTAPGLVRGLGLWSAIANEVTPYGSHRF
jgi:hypothetical protein